MAANKSVAFKQMAANKSVAFKQADKVRFNRMCSPAAQPKVAAVLTFGDAVMGKGVNGHERNAAAVVGTGYDRISRKSKAQLRRERTAEHAANRARKLAAR